MSIFSRSRAYIQVVLCGKRDWESKGLILNAVDVKLKRAVTESVQQNPGFAEQFVRTMVHREFHKISQIHFDLIVRMIHQPKTKFTVSCELPVNDDQTLHRGEIRFGSQIFGQSF